MRSSKKKPKYERFNESFPKPSPVFSDRHKSIGCNTASLTYGNYQISVPDAEDLYNGKCSDDDY